MLKAGQASCLPPTFSKRGTARSSLICYVFPLLSARMLCITTTPSPSVHRINHNPCTFLSRLFPLSFLLNAYRHHHYYFKDELLTSHAPRPSHSLLITLLSALTFFIHPTDPPSPHVVTTQQERTTDPPAPCLGPLPVHVHN